MGLKACITLILVTMLLADQTSATEKKPWLGNVYEFEFRPSLLYQGYSHLSSGSHSERYSSNDVFLDLSLSNSFPEIGLEAELVGAKTRHQPGNVDQIKLTGRYVWQDDIAGAPFSFVTGLSLIQAFHKSLKDVSSFHHGLSEAELFFSLGKEYSQDDKWGARWWGIFAIGAAADRGSPWFRFDVAYDKRFYEKHELRFLMNSLWGTGHHRLRRLHFDGYGPIQHQSVDLGIRYTYLLEFFGNASLEYTYRVHARNFPEYTHRIMAQVLYTFGL